MNHIDRADHSSVLALGGVHDDNSTGVQEIAIESPELMVKQANDVARFWILLWAIVLQQYTETQHLQLGLFTASGDRGREIRLASSYLVALGPESAVDELMSDRGDQVQRLHEDETPSKYNTGVLVVEDSFCDPADSMNGEKTACNVLLVVNLANTMPKSCLHYRRSALSDWYARRIGSTIGQAARQVLMYSNRPIHTLNLFSRQNFEDVSAWTHSARNQIEPAPESVVDLISGQARNQPNACAIDAWDGKLTFRELDAGSTRMAAQLRQQGVQPDDMVAVCFDRSCWAVLALVGILKAGAAFVPIDPSQPIERLQQIVKGTKAQLVIATAGQSSVAAQLGVKVDTTSKEFVDQLPRIDGHFPATTGQFAYVLHTSGSTGLPKGVAIRSAGLAHSVRHAHTWQINNESRVLQFAGYSFAISMVEVFSALTAGGTLCIPSNYDRMNNLESAIVNLRVTWALLTPSASSSLDPSAVRSCLRTLLLAGEAMSRQHVEKWADKLELRQVLGMTETSGICSVSPRITPGTDQRTIGNSQLANLWLVDPINPNRLPPVGAVAELAIEGPCIAQGYLNNEEKTAESFIQDPAWIKEFRPGHARLYRSGDLVQYGPEGLLYIGRKDGQVKVRGKRVELGEVEYHVRRHCPHAEKVIAAAAMPLQSDETPMLVVFIYNQRDIGRWDDGTAAIMGTATEKFQSQAQRLHSVVPESLPDYMTPDAYLPLVRLPMTRTGKMDHAFLRKLIGGLTRREIEGYNFAAAKIVQPETETERKIHSLYVEILHLDPKEFGVHDHFIRLGGDSVKAMRMVHAGRGKGLMLSVENILGGRTVAGTAHQMDLRGQQADEGYGSSVGSVESLVTVEPLKHERAAATKKLAEFGLSVEDIEAIYPCSPMQEGILLSQARDPNYYDIRVLWDVAGEAVDVGQLQSSWIRLQERHPLLRTVFLHNVTADMFAVQATLKTGARARVEILESDSQALVKSISQSLQATQPQDWLPQLFIYQHPNGHVSALLQLTHALTDAQSLSILTRDWQRLYHGYPPPPVELEYEEYVAYLQGLRMESAREFWKTYLDGCSPCILPQLATGVNGSARSFQAVSLDVAGSAADYHRFCEKEGITMATLFKLAWALVLRVYTGTETISFGYASSGRDAPLDGIEDTLGPFVNALIFHMKLPGGTSLEEGLQAVQSDLFRVLPHQRMSLGEIRKSLGHVETMFNTCITFPAAVDSDNALDTGISFKEIERHDPTEYDILLEVASPSKQTLKATMKYWTDFLSEAQASRLQRTLQLALAEIVKNPQRKIGQLSLMTVEDRTLLSEWNPAPASRECCVHELVEKQSRQRPDHPAAESRDGMLTYADLCTAAHRLALQLVAGAPSLGPNTFVPLCFSKTKWTPVAVLAVLKAGAAFFLVDPSQPVQRLQEICEELSPPLILASEDQRGLAEQLVPGADVIVVGDAQERAWESPKDVMLPRGNPRDLAYAVYTSGSTSKPRGVLIEHRSFCTSAIPGARDFSVFPESRVLQFASHAFDASVLDILAPLLVGATVCIPSEEDRRNRLAAAINEFQVTAAWLTPSVARLLSPEQVPSLKSLGLVGEAMSLADLQTWAPRVNLINAYGPAECSIMVTAQTNISVDSEVLIGRSTGSAATWVVDPTDHNKLMPIGLTGELIVEGPTVARGYLNRPEHTAASFIQPPGWLSRFRSDAKSTLYKTGDLVQYTDDGILRYIGRKDTQVKIRGQRVELGEIEHNVHEQFPADSSVTVEVVTPEGKRNPFLAAFVYVNDVVKEPEDEKGIFAENSELFGEQVSTVRSRVDKVLPSYMRPAVYVPLLRIPLSPSGKTNRRLLRELASSIPRHALDKYSSPVEARRAPSTEVEKVLQQYFAEVLSLPLEEIGADDHFFNCGGDSLTAMKLVGMARKANQNFSVKDVFEHPQLSALASVVGSDEGGEGAPEPFSLLSADEEARQEIVQSAATQCGISATSIEDVYPCTPLQEGLIAATVKEPGAYVVNLAFTISSRVDLEHLELAWKTVADANPILRTRIVPSDSFGMLQVVVREEVQWTILAGKAAYGGRSFQENIGVGSPLSQFIVEPQSNGRDGYELLVKIHHALYDAWSFPLILEQVESSYHGGMLSARPFSPFIRYLRSIKDHEAYWRSAFAGLNAPIFPRLSSKSYQPSPQAVTDMVVKVNPPASREFTQRTYLRLAWAIAQSHCQGSSDVIHGLVVSGRNASVSDIESLTAPTIATIPCRVSIDANLPVLAAMGMLQGNSMACIPYEQTGLQNISRYGPEASKACSFQTLLVLQQGESPKSSSLFDQMQFTGDYGSFASYAVTLICDLDGDSLKMKVVFDDTVLKEHQIRSMLSLFADVLQLIHDKPDGLVKDVVSIVSKAHGNADDLGLSTPTVCSVDETKEFWMSELENVGTPSFPSLPSAVYQPLTNSSSVHQVNLQRRAPSDFTTQTLIRAAWALLQARYSDSPETVVGCSVSGQSSSGNTVSGIVPFKLQSVPQHPTQAFLRRIQDQSTAMLPHQHYGLQNIARLSDSASAACNFQTLFVVHQGVTESQEMPIRVSSNRPHPTTVALALDFTLYSNGILMRAHFDDRVLSGDQVMRMMLQFEHVLSQLNSEPDGMLSDIDLISTRDKLDVEQWNKAIPDCVHECVHRLIEKQVTLRPRSPAICSWDGNMSYSQLDVISSRLACYLMHAGVGPEAFVPLCFEKSMWTIVAMFAVMKAGGAFVFLDPAAPLSRLETVIKEVGAKVMLCSDEQMGRFPGLVDRTIGVGPGLDTLTANPPEKLTPPVSPANAAYVLFTSGSTGTPKGSVIEHRAFCTAALAFREGLQMGDRVLQFASYAFDASLLEILAPLIQGGCVCVPSEEERRGNISLAVERMKVNWAVLTPSFASTLEPTSVPTLETLCLAGEAMSATLMETWLPYIHLVNGYGPSECCICSVSNRNVTGGPGSNPANIGTPVGGACWVVEPDNDQKLTPVGAIGELVIESHTVARHYLNNPEKTAAAFISPPSWLPFKRCHQLYKTGDLVRYMNDGSMVFIGRKDNQVKIRGQRVELGEIEYHMLSADVALGVVAYPKTGTFCKRLTAIVELCKNDRDNRTVLSPVTNDRLESIGFDPSTVSQHMSQHLPVHMVPDVWIVVEKLPTSLSAKIDRRMVDDWLSNLPTSFQPALGVSVQDMPVLPVLNSHEAKASAISTKIAELVSRGDSSMYKALEGREFTIASTGLDSIQVISLVSFIQQNYGVTVPVGKILDGKTSVRSLATFVESGVAGTPIQDDSGKMDVRKEADLLTQSILRNHALGQQSGNIVFVTGGTGFLGTQILRQLCDRPDVSKVIAHVRAATPEEAMARCKDAAIRAQWWTDSRAKKVEAWAGNLSKSRLGLNEAQWASLTGRGSNFGLVDIIVHAGAAVNWNAGYEVLRAANVNSTVELLQAAMLSTANPRLVYVSGGHRWELGETEESIAEQVAGANGYGQTKFASELLVKRFSTTSKNPGQFSVVKPGLIIGTPEEGVANTDDYLWRLTAGAVDIQAYSVDHSDAWVCMTSSARVAEETLRCAFCPPSEYRKVAYMTDGITESEFWNILLKDLQYPLRPMTHSTWMSRMRQSIDKRGNRHPLWPVKHTFEMIQGRFGGDPPAVDVAHRKAHVQAAVKKNVKFLVDVGFMSNTGGKKGAYLADKVFERTGNVWDDLKSRSLVPGK